MDRRWRSQRFLLTPAVEYLHGRLDTDCDYEVYLHGGEDHEMLRPDIVKSN